MAARAVAVAQRARARSAMAESLAKQRDAVRIQLASNPSMPRPPLGPLDLSAWPACSPMPDGAIAPMIAEISAKQGLTPDLMRAVIRMESAYRPCAVSVKGAQGLMQLMPETAWRLGVRDPFDPRQNLDGGARLLKQLLTRYNGDLTLALGAYNAGAERVDSYGGVPPFRETTNYVSGILGMLSAN